MALRTETCLSVLKDKLIGINFKRLGLQKDGWIKKYLLMNNRLQDKKNADRVIRSRQNGLDYIAAPNGAKKKIKTL